jgi:hypothetical protein
MAVASYIWRSICCPGRQANQSIQLLTKAGGCKILLKYYIPKLSVNPNRLNDITSQDEDWILSTNLATAAAEFARAVRSAFNNKPIHCVQ